MAVTNELSGANQTIKYLNARLGAAVRAQEAAEAEVLAQRQNLDAAEMKLIENAYTQVDLELRVEELKSALRMLEINLRHSGSDWQPWHSEIALHLIASALKEDD